MPSDCLLNSLGIPDRAAFEQRFGDIAENSPWIAERAYELRPFCRPIDLHAALMRVIASADRSQQLTFIRAHPELAGKDAKAGIMTESSTSEQGRLGLTSLDRATAQRFSDLNRRYRERFAMPCIIALRRHDSLAGLLASFEARLKHDPDTEIHTALAEIGHIIRGRLAQRLGMANRSLMIRVIDSMTGEPAAGVRVEVYSEVGAGWSCLQSAATDVSGSTLVPLLTDIALPPGRYRIEFHVDEVFRRRSPPVGAPHLFGVIPVELEIGDGELTVRVELKCSPRGYEVSLLD